MKNILFIIFYITITSAVFADIPELKSKEEFQKDSHTICSKDWTERGKINHRMYNHCTRTQIRNYANLKYLHHQYADQRFYSDTSYPHCLNKWTKRGISDARMIYYCLTNEIEGMKNVIYYRKQYGGNEVNPIVDVFLIQYKSWGYAGRMLRRHFEE